MQARIMPRRHLESLNIKFMHEESLNYRLRLSLSKRSKFQKKNLFPSLSFTLITLFKIAFQTVCSVHFVVHDLRLPKLVNI